MFSSTNATIFVVDDEADLRDAIQLLLTSVGLRVETFGTAEEFLNSYHPDRPGCLILDVRMPGMSGTELQDNLRADQITLPIIIITGHGDVPTTVRAMKSGAIDVLEKPFRDQALLELVHKALQQDDRHRKEQIRQEDIATRLALLTPRETEVMAGLMHGDPNKIIAADLGVSTRTVEIHRARIMSKMRAKALSTLVQMVLFVRPNQLQLQDVI